VDLWLGRFASDGVGGLLGRARGAAREQVPASVRAQILAVTKTIVGDVGRVVGDVVSGAVGLLTTAIAAPFAEFLRRPDGLDRAAATYGYDLTAITVNPSKRGGNGGTKFDPATITVTRK